MKIFLWIIISLFFLIKSFDTSKILMIYFSRSGNTKLFADYIKENIKIDSYQIIPAKPYPDDIDIMKELAKEERNNNIKPNITEPLQDINKYDIILLGYPLWHSFLPNIVINQIENLDFNGKTICPFNTYGSSGVGNSTIDIKNYAKGAIIKEGFPIKDSMIKIKDESMNRIKNWINNDFEYIEESNTEKEEELNNGKIININYFVYFILLYIYL